jgi:predicted nucleotidyltransferase
MFRYPLDLVLGKTANVRVLRELVAHGGLLPTGSLADATGMTRSAVQLALHELVRLGIVRHVGARKSLLYTLSAVHPLKAALTALYVAEGSGLAAVSETIADAVGPFEMQRVSVWIYGSVARREDGPDSDLDIVVAVETGAVGPLTDALRDRLAADAERLAVSASVIGIDGDDIRRLSSQRHPWWLSVCRDAVLVVGGLPDTVAARLHGGERKPVRDAGTSAEPDASAC